MKIYLVWNKEISFFCVVLQEKEALLKQGFQRDADRMQRDINRLKADITKEDESKPSTLSRVLDGIGTAATLVLPGFIPKVIGAGLSFFSRLFWKRMHRFQTYRKNDIYFRAQRVSSYSNKVYSISYISI